jgi:hypothetical protein
VSDIDVAEGLLRGVLAGLDPDAVPVSGAWGLWAAFDRVERLASSAKTLLARQVESSGTWRRAGFRSVAEQLAAQSDTSVTRARAMLETSRKIAELPRTAAALRNGELSTEQAEVVADTASLVPDAETRMLALASTSSLSGLREAGVRERARVDRDATHERIRRGRSLREYRDDEGAWVLHARGPVEAGLAFRAAIDPIVERYFKTRREPTEREPREAYAFDALIELATRDHAPAEAKQSSGRYLGLVRVDLEAMRRGQVEGDEVCDIAGLGPIPVRVAKGLLGDAVLKLVITKGVDVLHVTHLGRAPTVAQRCALWWQLPECTALDCTRTQRLEFDHRTEWHKTHHTRIDDGDLLCDHDHHLKTYFGWALVEGTGKRPFVPPDDPRHPKNKPKP